MPKNAPDTAKDTQKTAPYYVAMTDTFMSGWGPARNKQNKLILSCNDRAEAETVAENARARSEMTDIEILDHRPDYPAAQVHPSFHGRIEGDYSNWFEPGFFAK